MDYKNMKIVIIFSRISVDMPMPYAIIEIGNQMDIPKIKANAKP
jgi:hypothetical protein